MTNANLTLSLSRPSPSAQNSPGSTQLSTAKWRRLQNFTVISWMGDNFATDCDRSSRGVSTLDGCRGAGRAFEGGERFSQVRNKGWNVIGGVILRKWWCHLSGAIVRKCFRLVSTEFDKVDECVNFLVHFWKF